MPKSVSAHNFPVQLTSFVGRAAQLTEVRKLLADNWLVTLTGAGGAARRSWQFRSPLASPPSSTGVCGIST
jgi:hypothetical protein